MTTILTGGGSFAKEYLKQTSSEVVSIRELGEANFLKRLKNADTIIHNAATVEDSNLELSIERNFDFTRFLVRNIESLNPAAHLILLSSMSILDPTDSESYGDVLKMTPYAYSKYLAETFCLKSSLDRVSIVRFSTLFFQNPKKDGLSKLIVDAATSGEITIYNDGEAERDFLPVRVAAQYVNKIAGQKSGGKQVYTIASSQATSFHAVAKILKELLPELVVKNKALPGGAPVLSRFDIRSIRELGLIDFSLTDEIDAYLKVLIHEDTSL